MASEDNFLRLDPYNFDTEEEYINFYFKDERIENGTRIEQHNRRDDANQRFDCTT